MEVNIIGIKALCLIYGLVVLKALRDKYAIQWVQEGKGKKMWHYVGFFTLAYVTFFAMWMVQPISFKFIAAILVIASIGWIAFDILLNLFRGLKWNHIGDSEIEKLLGNKIICIKIVILVISLIIFITLK